MPLKNIRLQTGFVLFILLTNESPLKTQAVTNQRNTNQNQFSARGVGRALANCFSGHETVKCLQKELINTLEVAAEDNATWHYSDVLSFEKRAALPHANSTLMRNLSNRRSQRAFSDELADKILQVAETRSLRFELPKMITSRFFNGISDAVDEIGTVGGGGSSVASTDPLLLTTFSAEEGTVRVFDGLVDDKIEALSNSGFANSDKKKKKQKRDKDKNKDKKKDKNKDKDKNKKKKKKNKIWYLNTPKGRKKKDKDKNMAMMGGMAMMAMVAQMFLGKVILIAGAAFIMAKIALLVSVLGSLKKGTSGTSGSTTEHVIISGGGHGGGHSHDSGWHRSMPYDPATRYEAYSGEHESLSSPPISIEARAGGVLPPASSASSLARTSSTSIMPSGRYYAVKDAQEMPAFL